MNEADERLRRHGWTVTETGCWEWDGYRHPRGYGQVTLNRKLFTTHRLAYEAWVGPIPKGAVVRHSCNNPPCINPDHLSVGTQQDNMDDMKRDGRGNLGEKNGLAKLTWEQVRAIRSEYADGEMNQTALAKKYGIATSTLASIINRKTWKESA